MQEWFIINDLDEFTKSARVIVYNNFGKWKEESEIDSPIDYVPKEDKKDLDRLLTQDESLLIIKGIAKKQEHKKTKKIRYMITDTMFMNIIEQLNNRMVSNVLQSLVNKGLVESSYDESINDFIFWVKDENSKQTETD